jgi:hypothetical protein
MIIGKDLEGGVIDEFAGIILTFAIDTKDEKINL